MLALFYLHYTESRTYNFALIIPKNYPIIPDSFHYLLFQKLFWHNRRVPNCTKIIIKVAMQAIKPIILVKICYKQLYHVIQVVLKGDFLASADIKAFGHTSYWPWTFLHPGCFCLAYKVTKKLLCKHCSLFMIKLFHDILMQPY